MNESMAPAELLDAAARLVDRAARALDGTQRACGACGVHVYAEVTEGKVLERIGATPRKLRDAARLLRDGWKPVAADAPRDGGDADEDD